MTADSDTLRRSPEVTHLCSSEVAQAENGIRDRISGPGRGHETSHGGFPSGWRDVADGGPSSL